MAGSSAKSEQNKVQAVKRAIFMDKEHQNSVKMALRKSGVKNLLIIGTSDKMADKICERLELPAPAEYVRIQDVASKHEMTKAREMRIKEGKHIVPVPTIELKPHLTGVLIDLPHRIFGRKQKKRAQDEKSIVRPNFSYYGRLTVSDYVVIDIVKIIMVNKEIALELINIGVKDSKTLKDVKIEELAGMIEKIAPNNIVLALKPEAYNLRYQQLKEKKQNLNNLLSNGHIAVLSKALEANKQCHFALVDRFTVKNNIADMVQKSFPWVTVVQQPRAEADVAVAAASILARAKFVKVMDELSTLAGVELPKGGGKNATECAKGILLQYGEEKLAKLVKMHFANYKVLFNQDTL